MTKLSARHNNITEPQTLAMARISRELQANGIDVISLSIGEPDFIDPHSLRKLQKKQSTIIFRIISVLGYLDVRQAICTKFKRGHFNLHAR